MSNKRSLSYQRQCVEHCLHLLETKSNGEYRDQIEGARQACLSIGWFERRENLVRELLRLDEEAPALAALFRAFPESRITDVLEGQP
jgi:hypothetical protein